VLFIYPTAANGTKGVTITYNGGANDFCFASGGAPRKTILNIACDSSLTNTSAVIDDIKEQPLCTYTVSYAFSGCYYTGVWESERVVTNFLVLDLDLDLDQNAIAIRVPCDATRRCVLCLVPAGRPAVLHAMWRYAILVTDH